MGSHGIRDRVCIVGMGCIPFGEHWDLSTDDMLLDAATATLSSAGVTLDDIDAYWLGTAASGISGLTLSRALRIGDKPVTRLENMCATGSEALRNAAYAVASGAYDVAMAIGVEKLKDSGFSGLTRMSIPSDGTGSIMGDTTPPANFSLLAPAYAKKYGVDPQELKDVMARIAWKNHQNGAKNPLAQFRKAVAKEAICASPLVAGSLGVFDCSGVADGAAAAIVVRAEDAHRYTDKPLYVKGLSFVAGKAAGSMDPDYDFTTFPEVVHVGAPTPTPRPASPTPGPRSPWPRSTTASRRPSSSSWRTSVSPSGASAGRRCWPAPSTSTATCRSTPTAASRPSAIPSGRRGCG